MKVINVIVQSNAVCFFFSKLKSALQRTFDYGYADANAVARPASYFKRRVEASAAKLREDYSIPSFTISFFIFEIKEDCFH